MSDPKDKRPRRLDEEGLRRVLGGVGPLSAEDLALQRQRVVLDLGRAPSRAPPAKRKPTK
jgi:hypothetical protein